MAMFIAQELVLGVSGNKLKKLHGFRRINEAVDVILANKLGGETLEIDKELIWVLDFFQNRRAIELINYRFHNKDFQAFLNYEKNKGEVENKIVEYSTEIATKQQEITDYLEGKQTTVKGFANKLDDLRSSYNFVLLNQGFEQILKQKNVSKWLLFASIVAMGIITVSPLLYKIYKNSWSEMTWQEIAFGVGLELILIYFFRVILNEYNSVKTQIMQLELRVSLCQFIQSYAEYAKEIKQDDPSALEKFENVVFSNILADSRDMPSTFDSVEQIGNFIKNIKS